MEIRAQWTELLKKDMYKYMFEEYDKLERVYEQIFETVQSNSAYEKETTAVGLGKLTERKEGAKIIKSNALEGYTVYGKPRTWSDSYQITMEMSEDTPPEKIANLARSFADTWAEGTVRTQEEFCANLFNYGGYTAGNDVFNNGVAETDDPSGDLAYDSYPFFNLSGNNRSSKGGGTYYNGLASSLTSANMQTAYNLFTNTNNRNERDEIVPIKPDTLLIPSGLRFTARKILETDLEVGSANNDINVVQNIVMPVEWQFLTDSNAWFLGKRKKGVKFINRRIPIIEFYKDPETKAIYTTIDGRWGAYVNNWRFWVGSNFSTS